MKKRVLSLLLAVLMLVTALPMSASAADLPFRDVASDAWYYADVKSAYEKELINGKSADTFAPDDNLTYAETAKLAAAMSQRYWSGVVTLTNGTPWYQTYVIYCQTAGIISKDYDWNAPATRAGYMEIFANALPDDALQAVNTVPDGSIPDVPTSHPQAAAIYKLYRAGILQGSDSAHSCKPGDSIRRSEVAAILTRMMDAEKRISFSMEAAPTQTAPTQPAPAQTGPLAVTIDTSGAQNVPQGDNFVFKAVATGGTPAYTYLWQMSDDNGATWRDGTATKDSVSFPVLPANNIYIRAVVTDSKGATAYSAATLVTGTYGAPALKVSIPVSATVTAESVLTLNASATGGTSPYTYQWYYKRESDSSNTAFGKSAPTGEFKSAQTGSYQVYCVVTDKAGKTAASNTCTVTVKAPKVQEVSIKSSASITTGEKLTLTASVTYGTKPYSYAWYTRKDSGSWTKSSVTQDSITLSLQEAGNWECKVVVTDKEGRSVESNICKITVKAVQELKVSIPQYLTCKVNKSVTISAKVSGGTAPYTYTWYYMERSESNYRTAVSGSSASNFRPTFGSAGTWLIYCVVTDAKGNTKSSNTCDVIVSLF